jgi:hypothetical protein
MLEDPQANGVRARFSNGRELYLTSSLFRSVYSHLVGPEEILSLIKALDKIQQGVE